MAARTVYQEAKYPKKEGVSHKEILTSQDKWKGEAPEGWQEVLLNALRSKPNMSFACKRARVLRDFVIDYAESNNDFRNKIDSAMEEGRDRLEEVMFDEALGGNTKYAELFMKLWKTGTKKDSDVKKLIVGWED